MYRVCIAAVSDAVKSSCIVFCKFGYWCLLCCALLRQPVYRVCVRVCVRAYRKLNDADVVVKYSNTVLTTSLVVYGLVGRDY